MEASSGRLYVVATPIGNLSDLSPRAVETLSSVDFIAAEDTRVTLKLLNRFGISKPLISCYKQNEAHRADVIIGRIAAGESCALCSDAGTPAVSDPGEKLVCAAYDAGIPVVPVPGPSAVITALSASGLATGRFVFEGFLSVNKKQRKERLAELSGERRTVIFYEAPHKLRATLGDLAAVFGGDRPLTIARELTKLHEEFIRTTLDGARELYRAREPRGEYVLVLGAAKPPQSSEAAEPDTDAALERVRELQGEGLSLSRACAGAAAEFGVTKSELYRLALKKRDEA